MRKEQLLLAVKANPLGLREMLKHRNVVAAMESLGILINMFELHAAPRRAKGNEGLGATLCNYRGRRHPSLVTCKKCLAKLKAIEAHYTADDET
jgi:hypothetical protein